MRQLVRASPGMSYRTAGLTCALFLVSASGCTQLAEDPEISYEAPKSLQWGEGGPSFQTEVVHVSPYLGDNSVVMEAQDRLPTGLALHSEVILRSCGPLGGVCHNRKEYPDLRSSANFLLAIGAPCNIQSGSPEGVFDRCERVGDQLRFAGSKDEYEIGWVELVPGDFSEDDPPEKMAGLHIHLSQGLDGEDGSSKYRTAKFIRRFVNGEASERLSYASYEGRWFQFDEGRHLVAEVRDYRIDLVTELISTGIEQGDLNRNGIFGATVSEDGVNRGSVKMIEPGDPERSYLIARLRGHMEGQEVPGTRMPLANAPFSVAEMVSLFCFIEGLPQDGRVNMASDIDYDNCSYADPETHRGLAIEGAGNNWADRISLLLAANCGGCHSKDRAEGDLVLVGEDVYSTLLDNVSPTDPEARPWISPGDPEGSYLFLKLKNDPSIVGKVMPFDPLEGTRTLADDEMADIESWIVNGAVP